MKNWKTLLGIGVVFLLGMVAGGLLAGRIIDRRIRAFLARGPDAVVNLIETRLDRELHLDASQKVELAKAVERARASLKEVRHDVQPRIDDAFGQAESDIRAILRPEQLPKFEAIVARARQRWRE